MLKQTFTDFEVIIVNDGSTDSSMAICRGFEDPRIRYVEQENKGLAGARNAGIEHARGRYLGFIDADDTWQPEKVARHVEHLDSDPGLGLSYSFSNMMDSAGKLLGTMQMEGREQTQFEDLYARNVIGNGSNAMLRSEVFTGREDDYSSFPPVELFDSDLRRVEDLELWARIASTTQWKISCLPKPLINYRINPSGLSAHTELQRKYHFLALAKVAGYTPFQAEVHRVRAVAHFYWHQARILSTQRSTRLGLRAAKHALYYDWRTINGNHFLIICALTASGLLPRGVNNWLSRLASKVWGHWQHLRLQLSQRNWRSRDSHDRTGTLSSLTRAPRSYVRKKAMPNLFFLCHRHRLMFMAVSKNASSSLKQVMYREEHGCKESQKKIHELWGWQPSAQRAIDIADTKGLSAYREYVRFVVYRDPVDRFLSTYHNKVLYSEIRHPTYAGKRLEGMGLEQFINVTEAVLKIDNPLHIDEHIRRQSDYYSTDDVDWIVPVEKLDEFLHKEFGIKAMPMENKTALPRLKATSEQIERIRNLYARDYQIKPNWPG